MVNLDNKGIDLRVQIEGDTEQTIRYRISSSLDFNYCVTRIPYPREIQTRKECKNVLIEMVKMAAMKKREEGTV